MKRMFWLVFGPLKQWRISVIGVLGTLCFLFMCADTPNETVFIASKAVGIVFGIITWLLHKRWSERGYIKDKNDF